jgi:hypothetical protein
MFSNWPRGLASPEELGTTRSWVIPSEEHSPKSWMSFSNARSYRHKMVLCKASNQPQVSLRILRTHCPKNGRLMSVIRSKSHWRKKLKKNTYWPNSCSISDGEDMQNIALCEDNDRKEVMDAWKEPDMLVLGNGLLRRVVLARCRFVGVKWGKLFLGRQYECIIRFECNVMHGYYTKKKKNWNGLWKSKIDLM